MELYKKYKKWPKIELHRHLEASFSMESIAPYLPSTLSEEHLCLSPSRTLGEVLKKFEIIQAAFTSKKIIKNLTYEAMKNAALDNIKILELRYSPSFMCAKTNLSWEDSLDGALEGISQGEKDYKMVAGVILISSRDYGMESCKKTLDLALKYKDHVIGVDLAGVERGFAPKLYKKEFQRLSHPIPLPSSEKGRNLGITIHAGETEFSENIEDAVNLLHAQRIGHGIQIMHHPEMLQKMIQQKIHFEISLTSNFITQAVKTLEEHPAKKFLDQGLSLSLNTDDPLFFGIDLTSE
ncbi:MAG: hypothetical protein HYS98_01615, partial [Deltaproteobacteria bacterium]|nr:hypothetical protein [Deltaproteobacteria bacterium]